MMRSRTGSRLELHGRISPMALAAGAGKPLRTWSDQPTPIAQGLDAWGRLNGRPRPSVRWAHARACAEASDATGTKPSTPDSLTKPPPKGLTLTAEVNPQRVMEAHALAKRSRNGWARILPRDSGDLHYLFWSVTWAFRGVATPLTTDDVAGMKPVAGGPTRRNRRPLPTPGLPSPLAFQRTDASVDFR